jgi:hypothetical protein
MARYRLTKAANIQRCQIGWVGSNAVGVLSGQCRGRFGRGRELHKDMESPCLFRQGKMVQGLFCAVDQSARVPLDVACRAFSSCNPRRDMPPLRRGIFSSSRYSPAGLCLPGDVLGPSLVEVDSRTRGVGDRGAGCMVASRAAEIEVTPDFAKGMGVARGHRQADWPAASKLILKYLIPTNEIVVRSDLSLYSTIASTTARIARRVLLPVRPSAVA